MLIRRTLATAPPPRYLRPAKGSKLDPFKSEIGPLLDGDPDLPGGRVGELLEPAWLVWRQDSPGYSRAGALIFSKQTPDLLAGIRRCLWMLGGVPCLAMS